MNGLKHARMVAAVAILGSLLSDFEPASTITNVGPGKGSKGIVRGRAERPDNEHTVSKPQSASLKRLLAR